MSDQRPRLHDQKCEASQTISATCSCAIRARDALLEQLRLTNIDQLQCEAERDRYKDVLKSCETMTLELLRTIDKVHWYSDDLIRLKGEIQSALAQTEGK